MGAQLADAARQASRARGSLCWKEGALRDGRWLTSLSCGRDACSLREIRRDTRKPQ